MQTLLGVKQLSQPLKNSVVTIGNFDGLHLGHRKIISRVKELARLHSGPSLVFTFDPHPRQVLFPEQSFHRLFLREDLVTELENENVDYLVLEPFSRALSQLEPEQFVHECILKPLNPKAMVVGYDFSFGANRKGTLSVLEKILGTLGISLEVIPPQKIHDAVISSTLIRNKVGEGDVTSAQQLLGRRFYVEGVVEKGEARGRTIGFPTANIFTRAPMLPKFGVYAGYFFVQGVKHKAVANIGTNPTFTLESETTPTKMECHILDFNQNIYGETVRFEFVHFIRPEMKFSGIGPLVDQIKKDVEITRNILQTV